MECLLVVLLLRSWHTNALRQHCHIERLTIVYTDIRHHTSLVLHCFRKINLLHALLSLTAELISDLQFTHWAGSFRLLIIASELIETLNRGQVSIHGAFAEAPCRLNPRYRVFTLGQVGATGVPWSHRAPRPITWQADVPWFGQNLRLEGQVLVPPLV